jgi:SMP-30/Gluconolactonase/LRE-like region
MTKRLNAVSCLFGFALCLSLLWSQSTAPKLTQAEVEESRRTIHQLEQLVERAPDPAEVMYVLAVFHSRLGETKEAIEWLQKADAEHEGFDPLGDVELANIQDDPEFQRVAKAIHARIPAVSRSTLAYQISEKDLIPEGLAYDTATHKLYLSSLNKHKIVEIEPTGRFRDFVQSDKDGIWQTLGMKVDQKTRSLWVCSAQDSGPEAGSAGVFHYDLKSGKLIKKYLADRNEQHLFNDLVVSSNGDVYFTDSTAGRVYQILRDKDALEEMSDFKRLSYPNGIALSDDQSKLYVAHFNGGLTVLDLKSHQTKLVSRLKDGTLAGIDGLYFWRGTLIAVQNGIGAPRVAQFTLNKAGDSVEAKKILENRSKYLEIPTTGAIANGDFYLIANSQLRMLHEGNIIDPAKLKPVYILKMKLQ